MYTCIRSQTRVASLGGPRFSCCPDSTKGFACSASLFSEHSSWQGGICGVVATINGNVQTTVAQFPSINAVGMPRTRRPSGRKSLTSSLGAAFGGTLGLQPGRRIGIGIRSLHCRVGSSRSQRRRCRRITACTFHGATSTVTIATVLVVPTRTTQEGPSNGTKA